jgi:DNA-binding GntR family transcriptional regulator
MARPHQYQQIYAWLKKQIQTQVFLEGTMLPSENQLSSQFNTTRVTVRQALAELVQEGYIERRHGKGSFVKSPIRRLGLLTFKGFSEVVENAQNDLLEVTHLSHWPERFFYLLSSAEQAAGCTKLTRLRKVGDSPLMLEHSYLPRLGSLATFEAKPLEGGSLFQTLRQRHGIEVLNMEQSLWAIAADGSVATLLQVPRHTPIVYIERKYATNLPDVFVYSALYCNTTQYALGNYFS